MQACDCMKQQIMLSVWNRGSVWGCSEKNGGDMGPHSVGGNGSLKGWALNPAAAAPIPVTAVILQPATSHR